jgi:hypothetical protein
VIEEQEHGENKSFAYVIQHGGDDVNGKVRI